MEGKESWKARKRREKDPQVLARGKARAHARKLAKTQKGRAYLEALFQSGMTWENYGEWEIDHIIALAQFDLTAPAQYAQAIALTNLQPVWAALNNKAQHYL